MRILSPSTGQMPLDMVGSTAFGRYSKISTEQTFNMIITDGWLVPYAGHKRVATIVDGGKGRGIYSSERYNHLIVVAEDSVKAFSKNGSIRGIGKLLTSSGNVFISENNADQICICDQSSIYIYDFRNSTFGKVDVDFIPAYVTFQDGYLIAASSNRNEWRLSGPNNGFSWPNTGSTVGELQTKPDQVQAVFRFPGKGNLLLVFGRTVTEMWYDTGTGLFPYQKNTFNNIDYGCINSATIASTDNKVVWVGSNERSGPVIMFTDGNTVSQISNDGINFKLASLTKPDDCFAFCFKQDGRSFYQVTWPQDELTFLIDFESGKFFTLTDQYMGAHVAKRVAFFNNSYYFVSNEDGNLYELNSKYTTYDGHEIPRIRVCKNIRLPDASRFVVNNITFTLEQGEGSLIERVDLTVSKDGGASFGNAYPKTLNKLGNRPNKLNYWGLGAANDFVPQFRFWGHGRFVATDGLVTLQGMKGSS